jgi:hypothetical protein
VVLILRVMPAQGNRTNELVTGPPSFPEPRC